MALRACRGCVELWNYVVACLKRVILRKVQVSNRILLEHTCGGRCPHVFGTVLLRSRVPAVAQELTFDPWEGFGHVIQYHEAGVIFQQNNTRTVRKLKKHAGHKNCIRQASP